jgi:hypothetical protein
VIGSVSNVIPIRRTEPNGIERDMFLRMIERNPSVREAIRETDGFLFVRYDVNSADLESLQKLLSTISGFVPEGYHFVEHREDRLIEVIVPGMIGDRRFNVYMIRLPNEKWVLVETAKM